MKLMDDPKAILLDLVCDRFAVEDTPVTVRQDGLHLSCSCHLSLLMDLSSWRLCTTKQKDFKVVTLEEPILSVLSSRLSRQDVVPTVEAVNIWSTEDARCLSYILPGLAGTSSVEVVSIYTERTGYQVSQNSQAMVP